MDPQTVSPGPDDLPQWNFYYIRSQIPADMTRLPLIMILLTALCFPALAQPEYKDVAPIFHSKCASCHRTGGIAPFPLTTYSETTPFASLIQDAVNDGHMPPWPPDTSYTRFLGERVLTAAEKSAILTWISNGVPAGDTTLAPPPPVFPAYQLYGTPTMELQIPAFTSNAVTTDSYVCFSLPTNLTQDRFLRAFEIVPGNSAIVHHVLVNADTSGTVVNDLSGNCFTVPGDFGIGGYAPGATPNVLPGQAPLKLGTPLTAGSNIVLQIHYPEGSAGQVDSTKIRLYFYPPGETGIRPVIAATPLQNWGLFLPPNQVSVYNATFSGLPIDMSVLSAFPHSHKICTSLINYAHSGNDTIPLIRINNWDFHWQDYYHYRYPVKVPAGYQLFAEHVYDNTSNNPHNPNSPPQLVTAGLSTGDEMLFDGFQFTTYFPGDELIDIAALLANDSLLNTSVSEVSSLQNFSVAYPNPSGGTVHIRIAASENEPVEVRIYDLSGRLINELPPGEYAYGSYVTVWNRKSAAGDEVPAGIYFYEAQKQNTKLAGKIVISR